MTDRAPSDIQLARLLHGRKIDGLLLSISHMIRREAIMVSDNTLDTLVTAAREVRDARASKARLAGSKS